MGHKDLASTMRYLKAGYGKDLLGRMNEAFRVVAGIEDSRTQGGNASAVVASHLFRIKAYRVADPKRRDAADFGEPVDCHVADAAEFRHLARRKSARGFFYAFMMADEALWSKTTTFLISSSSCMRALE
jgi:hypothetical protein